MITTILGRTSAGDRPGRHIEANRDRKNRYLRATSHETFLTSLSLMIANSVLSE
jgi:hypothetical protein